MAISGVIQVMASCGDMQAHYGQLWLYTGTLWPAVVIWAHYGTAVVIWAHHSQLW